MKLVDYIKVAMRTCSVQTQQDQVAHGTMGLISEVGECAGVVQKFYQGHDIDRIHFLKELGDVCWMIAELVRALGIEQLMTAPEDVDKSHEIQSAICHLSYQASSVVNLLRTKSPDSIIATNLSEVLRTVAMLAASFGSSLDDVMQMNIEKLRKRYPDGFDSERSLHRDDGDL